MIELIIKKKNEKKAKIAFKIKKMEKKFDKKSV